jgi:hypothetical protein
MTALVYFTACTLDGFIAEEHDSLDRLRLILEVHPPR